MCLKEGWLKGWKSKFRPFVLGLYKKSATRSEIHGQRADSEAKLQILVVLRLGSGGGSGEHRLLRGRSVGLVGERGDVEAEAEVPVAGGQLLRGGLLLVIAAGLIAGLLLLRELGAQKGDLPLRRGCLHRHVVDGALGLAQSFGRK